MELNTRQVNVIERADQGLRAFFGKIYNFMAGGLVLSAVMAYLASQQPIVGWMYSISAKGISLSLIGWIVTLAPFALIFMMNSAIQKANPQKAGMLFWVFSALMGLSLGNIFLLYSGASIAQTFLITAGSFLALSIYGSSTKRDLSGLGSFLFMGLIGLILASLANIFFKSSSASFVISVIGVIIFAGFTVYDTNRLKEIYAQAETNEQRQSLAVMGALSLYLDFINLFLYLLRFMGERK